MSRTLRPKFSYRFTVEAMLPEPFTHGRWVVYDRETCRYHDDARGRGAARVVAREYNAVAGVLCALRWLFGVAAKEDRHVGHGVFMWSSDGRQSNRYGAFYVSASTYAGEVVAEPTMTLPIGTLGRARVWAVVVAARPSGHAGDRGLDIMPTQPNVGEVVDLGVGVVSVRRLSYDLGVKEVVVAPEDGRPELWTDPRALYRLHDQTVVFVEPTDAPCSPAPNVTCQTGVFANGDGTVQVKKTPLPACIPPKARRIGPGTFLLGFDYAPGEVITPPDC